MAIGWLQNKVFQKLQMQWSSSESKLSITKQNYLWHFGIILMQLGVNPFKADILICLIYSRRASISLLQNFLVINICILSMSKNYNKKRSQLLSNLKNGVQRTLKHFVLNLGTSWIGGHMEMTFMAFMAHGNVILDILEPLALQKYNIFWVFKQSKKVTALDL